MTRALTKGPHLAWVLGLAASLMGAPASGWAQKVPPASVESSSSSEVSPTEPKQPEAEPTQAPATEAAPESGQPPAAQEGAAPAAPAAQAPAAEAPSPPSMEAVMESARRVGQSWDVQLELGIPVWATTWGTPNFEGWLKDLGNVYSFGNGFRDVNTDYLPLLVRARVGYLNLSEPWYFSIGVTAQYDSLAKFAVGAQADITHIWGGVWGQLEAAYSFTTGPLITAAAGYKLFGAELRATHGGQDFGVLLKVRIPLGLIIYVREIYDKAQTRRRVAGPGGMPVQ